ncbi:MAG: NUDIX domain-containing protein [Hyphomonadaceae bacterium]
MADFVPASTILLVRDAPALEVLMVERHHQIDFASGALVFPGGKVAKEDSDPAWASLVDGDPGEGERAFRIAALREAFEESGLLLARPASRRGAGEHFAEENEVAPLEPLRDAINKGEVSFLKTIQDAGLVLALDALTPFAHWITPKGMPKRFDTRFYIARAPAEQEALCDGSETVDACWITPNDALAAAREKRRTIIFPTRLNVEMLAEAASASDAIERSRTRKIVTVTPEVVQENGAPILKIPAEAGYSVTSEPLEGNRP